MFGIKRKSKGKVGKGKVSKKAASITAAELRVRTDVRKDVPQLPKSVFQVYAPNPKCYLKLIVSIISDTGYWKGVNYLVEINFPSSKPNDYPIVPPKCKFMPGFQIYHPNINIDGAICLGLRKAWKPVMDLKYICYGLLTILQDPNPMDPLNMEASAVLRRNEKEFHRNVMLSLVGRRVAGVEGSNIFPAKEELNQLALKTIKENRNKWVNLSQTISAEASASAAKSKS